MGLGAAAAARLEQFADQRDVTEQRDALDRAALVVVEQPADREHLAVVDGQHRLERPLVEDEVAVARRDRPGDARHLPPAEPLDPTPGVYLPRHPQLHAALSAPP